ncbi:MAG TPA: phosphate acyltransferase PlsX, partial [Ignavibacteriaceae bacterium]|nr:phosphate acyltransferase PlsX [Ignavibacteriaceae bacterium]
MYNSDPNSLKCRIVIDAMGGDFAPQNIVLGAVQALNESRNIELFLVGRKIEIKKVLQSNHLSFKEENIINADELIEMGENPVAALRLKPNSSIVIGAGLVKEKKADAFVSAGNTGAVMSASTLIIGRLSDVGRPTIGAEFPNINGKCYVYDVGAGKDAKPQHLFEYAVMGSIYAREIGNIKNPSIGILSMGEEEGKGNELTEAAAKLLKKSNLNFVGNVEGRDILTGKINVIICDGFVGNILLKFGESVVNYLKFKLKEYSQKSFWKKLKVGIAKNSLKEILREFD